MSVSDNIAYPLKIKHVARDDRRETVREAAEIMQIDDLLDKHPGELSGGQQQRAALARTLVQDPVAFLMDEPLSDLDAQLKLEMRKEIQRVHKRLGKPTIYVTHDQQEATTMSDRIVVLKDGQIEQVGTPNEIYDRPNNMFVASFVGSPTINYLDGTVTGVDRGAVALSVLGERIRMPIDDSGAVETGDDLTIGVRPQAVSLAADPDEGTFDGQIFLLEPVVDRVQATIDGPSGDLQAVLSTDHPFEEGQQVGISLDPTALHVFDPDTGVRLATAQSVERGISSK
jgi:multiple sugar transport system ATP-binding protein